ncbi:MAG TPA: metalloregulator ArsR/SmtB family transcription factor [Candidatus Saccharimonadales bacterium]|nr:metalloregulator ArsR/SmtB family transcription factor [Candidatus Saccharimonadales bacterium]
MVEYTMQLDSIFGALADSTRRDILRRIARGEMSISEIAEPYSLTFAAISKHLKVLEKAKLITKRRRGKEQVVYLAPKAFASAEEYLEFYRSLWEDRLNSLDKYLNEGKEKNNGGY